MTDVCRVRPCCSIRKKGASVCRERVEGGRGHVEEDENEEENDKQSDKDKESMSWTNVYMKSDEKVKHFFVSVLRLGKGECMSQLESRNICRVTWSM